MTLNDYQRENKPLGLKVTSVLVIISFLVTQTDLRLAYGMSPAVSPVNIAGSKDAVKQDHDDIHYMDNLNGWQWDDKTLSPAETLEQASTQQAGNQPAQPPVPSAIFDKTQAAPLSRAEGEAVESEGNADGRKTTRYTYKNQSYFEVYADDEKLKGKISAIGDFTNADHPDQIEARKFFYLESGDANQLRSVRIVTQNPNQVDTYQIFRETDAGEITYLLESGVVANGNFIKLSIYDQAAHRATFYDPLDANFKLVSQLSDNFQVGRVLEYRNQEGSELVHLEFHYDDAAGHVTSINWIDQVYSVYEYHEGFVGNLLELGITDATQTDPSTRFKTVYSVELSQFQRGDEQISVYAFFDPSHPDDLLIRERLPEQGIGRILRWRGRNNAANAVDLEYFYDRDKTTGTNIITVFNYLEGTYLKMELASDADQDNDGLIDNLGKLLEAGVLSKGIHQLQTILTRKDETFEIISNDGSIRLYEALFDDQIGRILRLRGPPSGGPNQSLNVVYQYDDLVKTRIAYDLVSKQYAITSFGDSEAGPILETGVFTIAEDGSYLRTKTTTLEPAVTGFTYDSTEARSFDYAFSILEEGRPAAVIVNSLTSDDLGRLLTLSSEVGILVMNGRIVLFTSGAGQEIRVLEAVQKLLDGADLVAHTHPASSTPLQNGPSQGDIEAASGKLEYVITSKGVFAYNQEGQKDGIKDFSAMGSLLQDARGLWKGTDNEGEVLARLKLQQFISSMDILEGAEREETEQFRSGETTPQQDQAIALAKDTLQDQLRLADTELQNITVQNVQNTAAADVFTVSLDYQNIAYEFSANITANTTALLKITTASEIREFNAQGRLSKITDIAANQVTVFQYNDSTRQYTETAGTTIRTFSYGNDQSPLTQDDVFLALENVNQAGDVIRQELDLQTRVVKLTNVTKNTVTTYEYNDVSRQYVVTEGSSIQTFSYGNDSTALTSDDRLLNITSVNAQGETLFQEFDNEGRVARITNRSKNTITVFVYNNAAKTYTVTTGTTEQTLAYGADNIPGTEDDIVVTIETVDQGGDTIVQQLDASGRVIKLTNKTKNSVTTFVYDDSAKKYTVTNGSTVQTLSYGADNIAGNDDDKLLKVQFVSAEDETIVQEIDAAGRVTKITNLTKNVSSVFFYNDGAKIYTITSGTTIQTLGYGTDNLAGTEDDVLVKVQSVNNDNETIVQEFNAAGRVIKITNTTKNTTSAFNYNDAAKTYTITSGGTIQTLSYGLDQQPGTDDDGLISTESANQEGDSLTQELDGQGRVIKITNNTKNTVTTFQYNDAAKTYMITSGTMIQTLAYGADNQ
ncbi:MAG: RHS repeat protein, partial [Candidatus Omnitrophica bacterium]|nr:RHS repeat protein [Candidatus Omnitrophota bacterium]